MRTYRGRCEDCGQTVVRQLGWHTTPYRNTCTGMFRVVSVTEKGRTFFTASGKPVPMPTGQVTR